MRVGLGEQGIGFVLEGLHGVGPASEASWRFLEPGELHDRAGDEFSERRLTKYIGHWARKSPAAGVGRFEPVGSGDRHRTLSLSARITGVPRIRRAAQQALATHTDASIKNCTGKSVPSPTPSQGRMPAIRHRPLGMIRRGRLGNIATPNLAFRGQNTRNQAKILPAVLAKIVDWRGFPGNDRTDC